MRLSALFTVPLIPVLAAAQQHPLPLLPPPLHVQVDSTHHRVLITGGPYRVPVSPEMPGMMMDMPATPVQKFAFPVDGWLQGFRLGTGRPVRAYLPGFHSSRQVRGDASARTLSAARTSGKSAVT